MFKEIHQITKSNKRVNFDKILNQDQSANEGLKQATKLEIPAITAVNTPQVNTGRER